MTEASRCLTLAEAGTRKQLKATKPETLYRSRFQHGLEWEVLHADAVVLLGLTHALKFVPDYSILIIIDSSLLY